MTNAHGPKTHIPLLDTTDTLVANTGDETLLETRRTSLPAPRSADCHAAARAIPTHSRESNRVQEVPGLRELLAPLAAPPQVETSKAPSVSPSATYGLD